MYSVTVREARTARSSRGEKSVLFLESIGRKIVIFWCVLLLFATCPSSLVSADGDASSDAQSLDGSELPVWGGRAPGYFWRASSTFSQTEASPRTPSDAEMNSLPEPLQVASVVALAVLDRITTDYEDVKTVLSTLHLYWGMLVMEDLVFARQNLSDPMFIHGLQYSSTTAGATTTTSAKSTTTAAATTTTSSMTTTQTAPSTLQFANLSTNSNNNNSSSIVTNFTAETNSSSSTNSSGTNHCFNCSEPQQTNISTTTAAASPNTTTQNSGARKNKKSSATTTVMSELPSSSPSSTTFSKSSQKISKATSSSSSSKNNKNSSKKKILSDNDFSNKFNNDHSSSSPSPSRLRDTASSSSSSTFANDIPFYRSEYVVSQFSSWQRLNLNSVTGTLDASIIYGVNADRLLVMRTKSSGKLRVNSTLVETPMGAESKENLLINTPNPTSLYDDDNSGFGTSGFFSGDSRINHNPILISMVTLLVREHNRRCNTLASLDPSLNDEQLFQRARRWVIAVMQRITMEEYLPLLTGQKLPTYVTIDDSGSAAPKDMFYVIGSGCMCVLQPIFFQMGTTYIFKVPFESAVDNPDLVRQRGVQIFLEGGSTQMLGAFDSLDGSTSNLPRIVRRIAEYLQRGRDHRISLYNDAREYYGLPRVASFAQLVSDSVSSVNTSLDKLTLSQKLEALYGGNIDRVDAVVGAMLEERSSRRVPFGPLFCKIILDQFQHARNVDPFWYERDSVLESADSDAIASMTFNRLSVLNTLVKSFPRIPFIVVTGPRQPSAPATSSASNGTYGVYLIDPDYHMSWVVTGDTIEFTLTVTGDSYRTFGLGLCSTKMVGADVILASIEEDASGNGAPLVTVTDNYVSGVFDIFPDVNDNIIQSSVSGSIVDGVKTVTFSRLLNTGDNTDCVISLADAVGVAYALFDSPRDHLVYHGPRRGGVYLAFAQQSVIYVTNSLPDTLKIVHGVILAICWIILAPLSVAIARYGQGTQWWLSVHRSLNSALVIAGAAVAGALAAQEGKTCISCMKTHEQLGVATTIISLGQVILGFVTAYILPKQRGRPYEWWISRGHVVLGYSLVILSIIDCFLGIRRIQKSGYNLFYAMAGVVAFELLVFTLLEIRRRRFKWIGMDEWKEGQSLPIWTRTEVRRSVASGRILLVVHNIVVDVQSWIRSHPGGSILISEFAGADATSVFEGRDPFPGTNSRYKHSGYAQRILRDLAIARLADNGFFTGAFGGGGGGPLRRGEYGGSGSGGFGSGGSSGYELNEYANYGSSGGLVAGAGEDRWVLGEDQYRHEIMKRRAVRMCDYAKITSPTISGEDEGGIATSKSPDSAENGRRRRWRRRRGAGGEGESAVESSEIGEEPMSPGVGAGDNGAAFNDLSSDFGDDPSLFRTRSQQQQKRQQQPPPPPRNISKKALDSEHFRRFSIKTSEMITPKDSNAPILVIVFDVDPQPWFPGWHVVLQALINERVIQRPYSPISLSDHGLKLMIRVYPKGKMSSYLKKLTVGSTIQIRGPVGRPIVNHCAPSGCYRWMYMLSKGVGLTAMLELIDYHIDHNTAVRRARKIAKREQREMQEAEEEEGGGGGDNLSQQHNNNDNNNNNFSSRVSARSSGSHNNHLDNSSPATFRHPSHFGVLTREGSESNSCGDNASSVSGQGGFSSLGPLGNNNNNNASSVGSSTRRYAAFLRGQHRSMYSAAGSIISLNEGEEEEEAALCDPWAVRLFCKSNLWHWGRLSSLRDEDVISKMVLICFSHDSSSILFRQELRERMQKARGMLQVVHIVSHNSKEWQGTHGDPKKDVLRLFLPTPPHNLVTHDEMGFDEDFGSSGDSEDEDEGEVIFGVGGGGGDGSNERRRRVGGGDDEDDDDFDDDGEVLSPGRSSPQQIVFERALQTTNNNNSSGDDASSVHSSSSIRKRGKAIAAILSSQVFGNKSVGGTNSKEAPGSLSEHVAKENVVKDHAVFVDEIISPGAGVDGYSLFDSKADELQIPVHFRSAAARASSFKSNISSASGGEEQGAGGVGGGGGGGARFVRSTPDNNNGFVALETQDAAAISIGDITLNERLDPFHGASSTATNSGGKRRSAAVAGGKGSAILAEAGTGSKTIRLDADLVVESPHPVRGRGGGPLAAGVASSPTLDTERIKMDLEEDGDVMKKKKSKGKKSKANGGIQLHPGESPSGSPPASVPASIVATTHLIANASLMVSHTEPHPSISSMPNSLRQSFPPPRPHHHTHGHHNHNNNSSNNNHQRTPQSEESGQSCGTAGAFPLAKAFWDTSPSPMGVRGTMWDDGVERHNGGEAEDVAAVVHHHPQPDLEMDVRGDIRASDYSQMIVTIPTAKNNNNDNNNNESLVLGRALSAGGGEGEEYQTASSPHVQTRVMGRSIRQVDSHGSGLEFETAEAARLENNNNFDDEEEDVEGYDEDDEDGGGGGGAGVPLTPGSRVGEEEEEELGGTIAFKRRKDSSHTTSTTTTTGRLSSFQGTAPPVSEAAEVAIRFGNRVAQTAAAAAAATAAAHKSALRAANKEIRKKKKQAIFVNDTCLSKPPPNFSHLDKRKFLKSFAIFVCGTDTFDTTVAESLHQLRFPSDVVHVLPNRIFS